MELVRGLANLRDPHRGSVVTIGNYDGVHRGHQHMLATVTGRARELGLPATVVTFEPTPREYFEGDSAPARSPSPACAGGRDARRRSCRS